MHSRRLIRRRKGQKKKTGFPLTTCGNDRRVTGGKDGGETGGKDRGSQAGRTEGGPVGRTEGDWREGQEKT